MLKPLVTSLLIAHMSPSERLFEEGAILVDLDGTRLSTAKAAVSLAEARDATGYIIIDERIAKLFDEWMLIGRQEDTGFGGRIDLLAIAPDGSLVLIELKRDRTPREVVAQALDYAGWVEKLHAEDIATIYGRFAPGRSLAQDFRERFGQDLDEETLNRAGLFEHLVQQPDERGEIGALGPAMHEMIEPPAVARGIEAAHERRRRRPHHREHALDRIEHALHAAERECRRDERDDFAIVGALVVMDLPDRIVDGASRVVAGVEVLERAAQAALRNW